MDSGNYFKGAEEETMIYIVIPRTADRTEGHKAVMLTNKKLAIQCAKVLKADIYFTRPPAGLWDISTARTCLPRIFPE